MSSKIKIYSFPLSGHAHRVELFASVANIPHEVVNLDLGNGEHKKPEYLALNPDGQVPTLEDAETVVTDSNAILVYLAKKYAPAYLPDTPELQAEVQKFLTLAAGEIAFGPAAARLVTLFNASLDLDFAKANAEKVLNKLNRHMTDKKFLVADKPSIADIAIYSYCALAPEGGISLEPYSNLRSLLTNIESLDGFKPMKVSKVGLLSE